ncbi:MAG: DeoR/GlpR family DNA-binding transcription regulator, partial [Oscillospiraceae bacterium]|nr:DeoR/GlpR family DNA-binding transcription regulator [Oscillospiraceae bacterium]
GKLRRTYGGAVYPDAFNRDVPLSLRAQAHVEEKKRIAEKAVSLVAEGSTGCLDASSTVSALVPFLSRFNDLTVITNGPMTSLALGSIGVKTYCTGGILMKDTSAYAGEMAAQFFSRFNADIFFFSCRGVNDAGMLCDTSIEEASLRSMVMRYARKSVFLCDSSKFSHSYRSNICHLSDVDLVVSETKQIPEICTLHHARYL